MKTRYSTTAKISGNIHKELIEFCRLTGQGVMSRLHGQPIAFKGVADDNVDVRRCTIHKETLEQVRTTMLVFTRRTVAKQEVGFDVDGVAVEITTVGKTEVEFLYCGKLYSVRYDYKLNMGGWTFHAIQKVANGVKIGVTAPKSVPVRRWDMK